MQRVRDAFPDHENFNQAHNGYLEIYLNLGWIGVLCLIVLLIDAYRKIFAAYRKNLYQNSLWLCYFVVALLHNLTEAEFRLLSPLWIILLLGILMASAERSSVAAEPSLTALGVGESLGAGMPALTARVAFNPLIRKSHTKSVSWHGV
jgi:O-antigen ligase